MLRCQKPGEQLALGEWAALLDLDPALAAVAVVIRRQIRELALDHAAEGLGDDAYLARLKALRGQRDALTERTVTGLSGQRAVEWLRALSATVQGADVPEEKADLVHAIYERVVEAGPEIVRVASRRRRTPMGWRWRCQMLLWRPRQESDVRVPTQDSSRL